MDKNFFVQEMDRHSGMLYRVAYAILRNKDDCKDALQETALRAWEKRHHLREEGRFAAWVTRILINECYNIRRKSKRILPLEEEIVPSAPPPDPTLAIILYSLPEKLRLPLLLQYAEGMSYDEIARVLHLPSSTIRGRIYRAKQMLRKELEA